MKINEIWIGVGKTVFWILVVCGLTFFMVRYVGQRTLVEGDSMEPMIHDGDNLIVEKLTYRFRDPERFDIIVFPYEENAYFIKRIIGLPGERVRIDEDGIIYIGGKKLAESYGMEVIKDAGIAGEEIILGEEEYFVLGDNRNNSMDSRDVRVGPIQSEEIMGRAWMKIYPFDEFGLIRHYE